MESSPGNQEFNPGNHEPSPGNQGSKSREPVVNLGNQLHQATMESSLENQ